MAFEDYCSTLHTKIAAISGLDGGVRSPFPPSGSEDEGIPGQLLEFPIGIILPARGELEYSEGGPSIERDFVTITIYTAGTLMPEAVAIAVPFIKLMRNKMAANVTLDGLIKHIYPDSRWYEGPGAIRYGAKDNLTGIRFNYVVKENTSGDFTVSA